MNIHLMASSMNQNLELEASLGKKPIDSVFSKSTSGLEIIDPFCDPRNSEPQFAALEKFEENFSAVRMDWTTVASSSSTGMPSCAESIIALGLQLAHKK